MDKQHERMNPSHLVSKVQATGWGCNSVLKLLIALSLYSATTVTRFQSTREPLNVVE